MTSTSTHHRSQLLLHHPHHLQLLLLLKSQLLRLEGDVEGEVKVLMLRHQLEEVEEQLRRVREMSNLVLPVPQPDTLSMGTETLTTTSLCPKFTILCYAAFLLIQFSYCLLKI